MGGVSDSQEPLARNLELAEKFHEDLVEFQNKSKSTVSCYMADIRKASRIFADMGITFPEIRRMHLKQYIQTLQKETERPNGLQIGRMKFIFTALNSMMEFLQYEEITEVNVVPAFRKRYLKTYKTDSVVSTPRQVPSTENIGKMIYSIDDPMKRALHMLLAKTGIRRKEAFDLDMDGINLVDKYILLKPTTKRSNRKIPFDLECGDALERYLGSMSAYHRRDGERALFVNRNGRRCDKNAISRIVNDAAEKHGLHDPTADRLEQHLKFGPHNYRHWFTTALRKNGCPERVLRLLRGDAHGSTVDRYDHVSWEEIVEGYNACMPSLL